jgi:GntR family transcriptional regulator
MILYIYDIYNIISGGRKLDIIISNSSGQPIYEQIVDQMKQMIINGSLQTGEALPSMRLLAKDLRISVITTKRAYEELEREGFIVTMTGKGSFVAQTNIELLKEERMKTVEQHLSEAAKLARCSEVSFDELTQILELYYFGEE